MNTESKLKTIALLFIIVCILLVKIFFVLKNFMPIYHTCDDDFETIKQCGCLPHEGNYSYFHFTQNKYKVDTSNVDWDFVRYNLTN